MVLIKDLNLQITVIFSMLVSHKYNNKIYVLSNEHLSEGDLVFPTAIGKVNEKDEFIIEEFNYENCMSGFPDEPHIIRDLHHSDYKPYEIRTSHGYGPVEKYFKITAINNLNKENE